MRGDVVDVGLQCIEGLGELLPCRRGPTDPGGGGPCWDPEIPGGLFQQMIVQMLGSDDAHGQLPSPGRYPGCSMKFGITKLWGIYKGFLDIWKIVSYNTNK